MYWFPVVMLLQLPLVYVLYINAEQARSNDNTSVFTKRSRETCLDNRLLISGCGLMFNLS